MRKILTVAKREYVEAVKTKTFLIGVLMAPMILGLSLFVSEKMGDSLRSGAMAPRRIQIHDGTDALGEDLRTAFDQHNTQAPQQTLILDLAENYAPLDDAGKSALQDRMKKENLSAYVDILPGAIDGREGAQYYSRARNLEGLQTQSEVQGLINMAIMNRRLRQHNVSPDLIAQLRQGVSFETVNVETKGGKKESGMAVMMAPFFFLFLMFMGIFTMSQHMLTSVIEEKNSRVMEVLLAALSPMELMTGKILGLAAVGFTTLSLWAVAAVSAAVYRGMGSFLSTEMVVVFVVFYVLGFLMFASLYAAIGAACNTLKEAQNLVGPLSVLFILPLIGWPYLAQHAHGTLATFLSLFPPTAPLIIVLRLAVDPDLPVWQVAVSALLLAAFIPVVMWFASRVFRVGILLYGKPPTIREMVRWVRYK